MLLLRCSVFPCINYIWCTDTHSYRSSFIQHIRRYGWIIIERARTHSHEEIFIFASLFIGIGAMLVACVGSYIVCCLVRYTWAIVASSSHQKGVSRIRHAHIDVHYFTIYPAIFWLLFCFPSLFVHFEDSFAYPYVRLILIEYIKCEDFFSKSTLNGNMDAKRLLFGYRLQGVVAIFFEQLWFSMTSTHHTFITLGILVFVWLGELLIISVFTQQT